MSRRQAIRAAAPGLAVNLLYALYSGALGVLDRSLWFLTTCAYHALLGVMRFAAVLCGARSGSRDREYRVMALTGALLTVLSGILAGVIYLTLAEHRARKHGSIVMITIAAYTFYKITLALLRALRQRRRPSPLLWTLRGIGCADAAASVFTLQESMLVSFGEGRGSLAPRALTGVVVCLFIFGTGAALLRGAYRRGGDIQ